MSIDRLAGVVLAASLVLTITLACGDGDGDGGGSTGPDPTGSIEVTLTVAGDAPDGDGCVFTVDGAGQRRILSGESTTYTGLSVGQHEVAISDVAGNCQVSGDATRSVAVVADQTASVTYAVSCAQDVGSIAVSVSTSGDDQDLDGYQVAVGSGAPSAVDINGSVTIGGLTPGDHTVSLRGEAFNCDVEGDNPHAVTVAAGQETQVTFDVTCRFHLYDRIAFQSDRSGDWMLYAVDPYDPGAGVHPLGLSGIHPAVSPDGLRIAYGFEEDIWVARSDGSAPVRITNTAAVDRYPAWSPDGGWIAFTRDDHIWTMLDDGTQQTNINTEGSEPTWSPLGGLIAYVKDTGSGDISRVDADGGNGMDLVRNPAPESSPSWSPRVLWILFVSARDGGVNHVFSKTLDGEFNLTIDLISTAAQPTWAPAPPSTGPHAWAFSSDDVGTFDIYYFVPHDPGVIRLTTSPANDRHPSWGGGN